MKSLQDVKQLLRRNKQVFFDRYQVTEVGVFGSYAREEQTELSDVDAPTFFKLMELRVFLSELMEMDVDVVAKNGLKPSIALRG
jgi:predicted nucleotidyltransferase